MADRINLRDRALNTVSEALYGMTEYDADALRDAVQDRIHDDTDNACIYTHHCLQILDDYEREFSGEDMGGEYKAEDWQQAMIAHAYGVASQAMNHYADEALTEIEEAADELADVLAKEYPDAPDMTPRIGVDCPHGWAPHHHEDTDGTCHWRPGELEGCHAIARKVAGVWLSYTWTPEPAKAA